MKIWAALTLLLSMNGAFAADPLVSAREEMELHGRLGLIPGPAGQVEKIDGAPKVTRAGEGKASKSGLPLGSTVNQGDKIVTEEKARVHVRFRDKTYIEMDRMSAFSPERVRRGADRESDRKDESIFRYYYGFVRVTAPSVEPWVRYYVKHNERVLLLEGPSDFFLTLNEANQDLIIHVRKGKAWLVSATRGMKTEIPEGASRQIRRDNTIKELKLLSAREVALMRERTTIRVSKGE